MMRLDEEQPVPLKERSPGIILKTTLLVLSTLFGVFGLFFFSAHMNFRASSACLQLMLTCGLCLHPTCTALKGKLHETYSYRRFKFIFILAIIIGFIELMASIAFVFLGSITDEEFNFGTGFYVCAIPASLSCVWAFVLTHECRMSMRKFGMLEAAAAQVATQAAP